MEFVIRDPQRWLHALDRVSKASRPTSTRAGADGSARVRILAKNDSVELLACDEYVAARTTPPAAIQMAGGCCLPLNFLRAVLSGGSVGAVAVRTLPNKIVEFSAAGWHRRTATTNVDEIQAFPKVPDSWLVVPSEVMKIALDVVRHAADPEAGWNNPSSGIFLECKSGELRSFAANTCCAASAAISFEGDFPERLVIHQRSVREILHAIHDREGGHVSVSLLGNYLFIRTEAVDVAVRVIDLKMPELSAILAMSHRRRCVISRLELLDSLRHICDITGARDVSLSFVAGGLVLSAEGEGSRSAEDMLPAVCTDSCGPIVIDPVRLRDALSGLQHADDVVIEGGKPLEHVIIRATGRAEATIVLTPMQVGA
jgi:DNA polymerase III sliding clamp (beta) subunit (PCNA family)